MAVLRFDITIPDGKTNEILNDFVYYHQYQDMVEDSNFIPKDFMEIPLIPNPITKQQFAKTIIANFMKESIKAYKVNKEIDIARKLQIDLVNAIEIK